MEERESKGMVERFRLCASKERAYIAIERRRKAGMRVISDERLNQ